MWHTLLFVCTILVDLIVTKMSKQGVTGKGKHNFNDSTET